MLSRLQARFPSLQADGLRLLGLLLAVAGCTLLFIALSDEVAERDTQAFDERVLLALRQPGNVAAPRGPWWLARTAMDLTALGGGPVLVLVTTAVCGFLALVRHWRSLALVLGSTLGGLALNAALKSLFSRPRPTVVPHLTEVLSESFPSGHAMLSAIVYLTLGVLMAQLTEHRRLKLYVLGCALLLSFLIGLTRVYLGVHYPTDVLGGWVAGLAWALFVTVVAKAAKRRSPALRREAREGASE
jgi:undecaprenyl-diphosphatase